MASEWNMKSIFFHKGSMAGSLSCRKKYF